MMIRSAIVVLILDALTLEQSKPQVEALDGAVRAFQKRTSAAAALESDRVGGLPLAGVPGKGLPLATSGAVRELPPPKTRRIYRTVRWERVWRVGGEGSDTTLYAIISMAASGSTIIVVDGGRRRVLSLDAATGRTRWIIGTPGRGPGEFGEGMQVAPLASGGFAMIDGSNRRLRRFSADGVRTSDAAFTLGSSPLGLCVDDSGATITSLASGREVTRVAWDGTVLQTSTLPWPDEKSLPLLVRQSMLFGSPSTDVCVQSMTFGPFFAVWRRGVVHHTGRWIVEVPIAQVEERAGGAQRFARGARVSTTSIALAPRHFIALFRGQTPGAESLLDVYSISSGHYRFSLRMPTRAKHVVVSGETLVFAGESEEDAPFVSAYRLTPGLATLLAGVE